MNRKINLTFKLLIFKILHFDLPGRSAETSYYFIFSLVPFMILSLSIIPLFKIDVSSLLSLLETQVPIETIHTIKSLSSFVSSDTSNTIISIGVLLSVFSASAVVNVLLKNINRIYDDEVTRSFYANRIISMLITMIVIIFVILSIVTYTFTTSLFNSMIPDYLLDLLIGFKYLFIPLFLFLLLCVFYYFGPQTKKVRLQVLPGATFSVIMYYLFTNIYIFYISHFSSYSTTYGALTSLIVSLSWIYFIFFIILLGAVINSLFLDYKNLCLNKETYSAIISKYKINN